MANAPDMAAGSDTSAFEWSYDLVPSFALPTLDLSRSIKSRYIPQFLLTSIDDFLMRYNKLLFASYLIGLLFSITVPLLDARSSGITALISTLLGLPLQLGSIGTLRYDVVRLLARTYDFWFFLIVNSTTNLMVAMFFSDLRITRLLIDWTGFQNIVLIDAQLRGLRQLSILAIVGTFTVSMLLVCVMLGRVDALENFSLIKYHNNFKHYDIQATDVVGNGLITIMILLLKIVFRKRKTLLCRSKSHSGGAVIECAIFRCRVKLTPVCTDLASPHTSALHSSQSTSRSVTSIQPAAAPARSRRPSFVQQMRYVQCSSAFDARRTVLPVRVTSKAPFPTVVLLLVYSCGVSGFLIMVLAALSLGRDAEQSKTAQALHHSGTVAAFALSTVFTTTFAGALQRELLYLLLTSFDFFFYALQLISIHASLCVLYEWDLHRCLSVATAYTWILWVLMLDALTPMMRTKLQFHIRFAIPAVAMFILWHVTTLYMILGDSGPADRILWQGDVWDYRIVVRVVPFYFSRLVTLTLWCCRLVNRLACASNDDAIVLRGAVAYDNYLAGQKKRRSRGKSFAANFMAASNQVAPTSSTAETGAADSQQT